MILKGSGKTNINFGPAARRAVLHRVRLDVGQQCVRALGGVVEHGVVGVGPHAGEQRDIVRCTVCYQCARGVRGKVIALGELHDVTEHAAVLDMVTVDDAVGRGEVRRAA